MMWSDGEGTSRSPPLVAGGVGEQLIVRPGVLVATGL